MKTIIILRKFLVLLFISFTAFNVQAQDKEIAKVDDLISKAQQESDKTKKTALYNKASEIIMSAKLGKDQFVKIGDAYLEEGDINNAARFFMRCDADDKKSGYVKIGHKMIEQAFDDPKTENKNMRKAVDYFRKGGVESEGNEAVGDAYYNKGEDSYMKAAEFYASGKNTEKLNKLAMELIANSKPGLAAEVYMKENTEDGYKKAGDLYFKAEDYNNAFTAYEKGNYPEGIKKYADKLYDEGKISDGDAQYAKVGEMYAAKSNPEGLKQLAKQSEERGNHSMAAEFYDKAGEANLAGKARANNYLFALDFEGAKTEFETLGDADMIKAINASMKYLDPLKDVAYSFDEMKKTEPTISYYVDTITKKRTPVKADVDAYNSYYKDAASTIVDNCYIVSANVPKILHAGLKEAMMKKFKQYGAIRNVLDSSFGKKLQKTQVAPKDVAL